MRIDVKIKAHILPDSGKNVSFFTYSIVNLCHRISRDLLLQSLLRCR